MRFSTLMRNPADWMLGRAESPRVVISSRVRLARNLRDDAFPGRAAPDLRRDILDRVLPEVAELAPMRDAFSRQLDDLGSVEKRVLVERHLISREQAGNASGSGVVINRPQTLSVMINEEDHLRVQAISPGLDLRTAHDLADSIDTALEEPLDFAFDDSLGYLTSCPSNVGTGMRASVMVHLPALVLSDQINKVIHAVNKIGLAVRGLFGEGSEAQSNLFQVSNQTTLGESEEVILDRLRRVIEQIIRNELNAREKLIEDREAFVADQVGRACGILRHAHIISSKEALNHLSMLRLGQDLAYLPPCPEGDATDLLVMDLQPAHLQWRAGRKLSPEQRDILRADVLRERLQSVDGPVIRNDDGNGDESSSAGGDPPASRS